MQEVLTKQSNRFAWGFVSVLLAVAGWWPLSARAQAPDANSIVAAWLSAQTNIQTWSADFVQIRKLKAMSMEPLSSTGHVWFAAPGRFRWEIQAPTQTIVVRQADQLLMIYPKMKRAESAPLNGKGAAQWKDMLALLDAGFPRNRAEVESRFKILAQRTVDGLHEITLEPKSDTARQFMPQIKLGFDAANFSLRSTEMQLGDGSTVQNVFSNSVMNPKIEDGVFNPQLGSDYHITQPLK